MHIVLRHDLCKTNTTRTDGLSEEVEGNLSKEKKNASILEKDDPSSSTSKYSFNQMVRFSQPAHLIVLITVVFLAFVLFPKEPRNSSRPSTLSSIIYLGSFAFHFGAQLWMTFISGIVLFFTIPRHVFGLVQKQLFPKYFLINSVLAFLTLTSFLQHHSKHEWSTQHNLQIWALVVCFFTELLTRLYVVPEMLVTLQVRMSMEMNAGVGSEIGYHNSGKLKNCLRYIQLHKHFRRLHGITAVANMIALACNGFHLYHLAAKFSSL